MTEFTEYFNSEKTVWLKGLLLDQSPEYSYMDPRPAVLVIPGGGYHMCSDREGEPIAMLFASQGYNTFILQYTVGETGTIDFDQPFGEAQKALSFIRDNAEKFHIDPKKVAAIGFSAGGHLCSALGTIKPDAMILGYPCTLNEIGRILAMDIPQTTDFVSEDTPPTFIFAASDDTIVPIRNSLEFASACADNNVECELHVFAKGGHGFSLSNQCVCGDGGNEACRVWQELCLKWLNAKFFN